jgi:aspartate/methionine/tyrosine aminotransferase
MGEAAIRHDELFHGLLEHMVINRKIVRDQLAEIDFFELTPAEGAFYQYICLSEPLKQMGSSSFCHRLLEEIGVAITPGKDFDPYQGESFVRLSYAGHTQDVQDGLERLRIWLKNF